MKYKLGDKLENRHGGFEIIQVHDSYYAGLNNEGHVIFKTDMQLSYEPYVIQYNVLEKKVEGKA